MNIASIDIGTNTVLLLVASTGPGGTITPLVYEQRIPRLGKGVDSERRLQRASMDRVIAVLKEYREIIAPYRPTSVVVCATSAVRDAANRDDFVQMVLLETEFRLEVLSGEEESLWTYRGAISGAGGIRHATVLDIGGGSTEITTGTPAGVEKSISLDVGSVRITERLLKHDPPRASELAGALSVIRGELARAAGFPITGSTLVAVAGTATTLALLAQGSREFDIRAVSNCRLERSTVEHLLGMLRRMSSGEIRELSAVMAGREDVITAGALILNEVMEMFGFDSALVSERGVRYGLVLRELERV